jgi:hypothetical protein
MNFFVIQKKPKGAGKEEQFRTDFTYDDSVLRGDAPKCPKCGRFVGMLEALPPYQVHLETWGEGFGDLAFWMTDFLANQAFRDSFLESGLKGLSPFTQVSVLTHNQHGSSLGDMPRYFRTIPVIGGARIDFVASGVEWKDDERPTCDHCLQGGGAIERWQRVILDEQSWTGDDVFVPFGFPSVLLASERFHAWAEPHQFKNLLILPAEQSQHDFHSWKKQTDSERNDVTPKTTPRLTNPNPETGYVS